VAVLPSRDQNRNFRSATVAEFVANIQAGKFGEVVPEELARALWARRNGDVVAGIASRASTRCVAGPGARGVALRGKVGGALAATVFRDPILQKKYASRSREPATTPATMHGRPSKELPADLALPKNWGFYKVEPQYRLKLRPVGPLYIDETRLRL